MNWFRSAKSAYDNTAQIINNVQQFSSTISSATTMFSSGSSEGKSGNEQPEKVNLNQLEPFESDFKPFRIFIQKTNASAETSPPTIFHLVFVEHELTVFKTANLQLMRQEQARLNKLIHLARASVENHLLDKFLAVSNKNQDWEDIHLACRLGLPAYVDLICAERDPLSIVNCATREKGLFPIQLATQGGFIQLVSKLIYLGADINKCDLEGRNLLHYAVESSTPTAVEILKLLATQNPKQFTSAMFKTAENGLNPVQVACQGSIEALKIFFAVDKNCARHKAEVLFNQGKLDPDCLDFLLLNDAELILLQKPAQILHKPFKREILKVVAQRAPFAIDFRDPATQQTPLHSAANRSDLSAAVQLLAHGAEVDAKDEAGNTPLHLAVNAGATVLVKLLLCFGADIAVINEAGVGLNQKTTVEVANLIKQAVAWSEQSKLLQQFVTTPPTSLRDYSQQAAFEYQLKNKKKGLPSLRLLSLDGGNF